MTVQGSEFLAFGRPAQSPEEALALLAELRARYPDASHHVWAYRIGAAYRFSDDGEPGGTAGAPVLRAIQGSGLDRVAVVVVRYFGGTKLGTGGLVRAYGGAAAELLRGAPRLEVLPQVTLRASVPFAAQAALYRVLEDFAHERGPEDYTASGLGLALTLNEADLPAFTRALTDATRGAAVLDMG